MFTERNDELYKTLVGNESMTNNERCPIKEEYNKDDIVKSDCAIGMNLILDEAYSITKTDTDSIIIIPDIIPLVVSSNPFIQNTKDSNGSSDRVSNHEKSQGAALVIASLFDLDPITKSDESTNILEFITSSQDYRRILLKCFNLYSIELNRSSLRHFLIKAKLTRHLVVLKDNYLLGNGVFVKNLKQHFFEGFGDLRHMQNGMYGLGMNGRSSWPALQRDVTSAFTDIMDTLTLSSFDKKIVFECKDDVNFNVNGILIHVYDRFLTIIKISMQQTSFH